MNDANKVQEHIEQIVQALARTTGLTINTDFELVEPVLNVKLFVETPSMARIFVRFAVPTHLDDGNKQHLLNRAGFETVHAFARCLHTMVSHNSLGV